MLHHGLLTVRRRVMAGAGIIALIGATTAANVDQRLADAAERQDWRTLHALLEAHAPADAPQPDGATALHWAVHWDARDAVDALLAAGADVDAANDLGLTPLFLAAENGSRAVAARLLAAGADAGVTLPAQGETVLMRAAHTGDADVVRLLLDRGADVNARTTRSGQTALMWAISENHVGAARLLIEHGADVRARSHGNYTPLLFASRVGSVPIGKMLIEAGAPVDRDGDRTAPLVTAIDHARVEFARFLLGLGAEPDFIMRNGNTPLGAAIAIGGRQRGYDPDAVVREPPGKLDLIRELIAAGADVNRRRGVPEVGSRVYSADGQASGIDRGPTDPDNFGVARSLTGASPFWIAAHKADVTLMQLLLEHGADPTVTTDDGTTPLMAAAGLGHAGDRYEKFWSSGAALEAVKILVELGADVNAANEAGFTALHGAAFVGANAAADHLIEHGADLNAQDFIDRTPYRIAQGHKGGGMSFVSRPSTVALLKRLGANTGLGPHFNETEREEGLRVR